MTRWMLFSPEIFALAAGLVFLILSLLRPDPRRDFYTALILSALGVAVCLLTVSSEGGLFTDAYRIDLFSQVFKCLLNIGLFLIVCLCGDLSGVDDERHPEFYLLLAICTLSMMLLVSSVHLLPLYVSLELSSYSLYFLVFLRKGKNRGVISGIQYFMVGASASAVMLFGLALLYGACGTAYIRELMQTAPALMSRDPSVLVGLLMALCGFFFKLALFPFHFWAADAYEGAPHQAAAYISTVSKVAAIAVLVRMAAIGEGSRMLADGLAVLAIASMTIGNLAAIAQKDLKRLLAFSSVAHAGYVMIGVLAANAAGYAGVIFYAVTVLVLKFTCFLVVIVVARGGDNVSVDQLAGLHRRAPLLAMALMLALFGLAGIPPTIGFTGKLLLFVAAMENGYLALILIAMVNVVISLYYYLLVLKAAYLKEPENEPPPLPMSYPIQALTLVLVLVIVVAGFYPTPLINLAQAAALRLL